MGKPAERRKARRAAKDARREQSTNLQNWLTSRKEAAEKHLKEKREERKARREEVAARNNPPVSYGLHKPIVEHSDANYASRRQMAKNVRLRPQRTPRDTIFHKVNWKGELTNEKVDMEGTLGPVAKVEVRRGSNQPHVNLNRDEKRGKKRK